MLKYNYKIYIQSLFFSMFFIGYLYKKLVGKKLKTHKMGSVLSSTEKHRLTHNSNNFSSLKRLFDKQQQNNHDNHTGG